MKRLLAISCAFFAILAPLSANAADNTAANGSSVTPVPIDYWAVRDAVSNVSISPNGTYLALMKITSKDGNPVIEIYETANLSKAPRRLNAKPMEFLSIDGWLSDDVFLATAMQIVRKHVKTAEADVRNFKALSYSVSTDKFTEFQTPSGRGVFEIVSVLPKEPNHILAGTSNGPSSAFSDDPLANFRPRSYYRVELGTGKKELVYRGGGKQPQASFDNDGNPRLSQGIDAAADEIITYYRNPGETSWKEIMRQKAEVFDRSDFAYRGDVPNKPGFIYVTARHNGEDKIALWEYNTATNSFGTKVYGNPEADVTGVQRSSNFWAGDDTIVAARYSGAKLERHWLDQEERALYAKIKPAIKNAFSMSITSRSRDGNTMIVSNTGPSDSGTYYLIKDGKVQKLGSRNPLLKAEDYSNVEYIKYPARDGLMIPAYVTKPKGAGPHPLIVLPHGGPYVNEIIVYDEWSQMLANNGYMVIQPQYRGSEGHGWNHFIKTWHQHGLAMQDDKDDGAKYLIAQGKVDPDRVAMFGWSYGGYAALVAASRSPNLYQCVVAGAAVADPMMSYNGRKNDTFKYFDDFSAQRGGKVGISPIDEVEKVNVPILLVHGDLDRRVLYKHFTKYRSELKKEGKTFDEMTLKKADHQLYTMRYGHFSDFYTKMLDYLKTDCGPGGL